VLSSGVAQSSNPGRAKRLLKQQPRCRTTNLLGVVAAAFGRRAGPAPIDPDAFQHVTGIAVRVRGKNRSSRNMHYFHFAPDLELLPCHRRHHRLRLNSLPTKTLFF
jgi:hypothetical protein